MFLRVQMPIGHHWFMQWLGTEQVPSHWLNQWWPSSVTHTCITRLQCFKVSRYNDVIMSAIISQITSLTIVYSTIYSGTEQRKHGSSASLAFVWGIHRWPVNSPHKRPVTQKNVSIWWHHHGLWYGHHLGQQWDKCWGGKWHIFSTYLFVSCSISKTYTNINTGTGPHFPHLFSYTTGDWYIYIVYNVSWLILPKIQK